MDAIHTHIKADARPFEPEGMVFGTNASIVIVDESNAADARPVQNARRSAVRRSRHLQAFHGKIMIAGDTLLF